MESIYGIYIHNLSDLSVPMDINGFNGYIRSIDIPMEPTQVSSGTVTSQVSVG